MENFEIKAQGPKGYKLDIENSTDDKLVFIREKEIKTFNDIINKNVIIGGHYINSTSMIDKIDPCISATCYDKNVFYSHKEALSSLAASMISQLIPYYGGAITESEWGDEEMIKYTVIRQNNDITCENTYKYYSLLAFRTEEFRNEFMNNCEDLVRNYFLL